MNVAVAARSDSLPGFIIEGIDAEDLLGSNGSISDAGDVNGDGIDDVIVAARQGDPGGRNNAGEAFVVFGRIGPFPSPFELADLLPENGGDGSLGFVLEGIDPGDDAGISVDALGDFNDDGIDDLIIGANFADRGPDNSVGEIYVVFGRSTAFPASFLLSSLLPANGGDGSQGFVLQGIDAFDLTGWSVGRAGDVNGDDRVDLVIGGIDADPPGRENAGEVYVVFGSDLPFPAVLLLSSLFPDEGGDGSVGFVLEGVDAGDEAGGAVSAAGDVNADGIGDFLIGAQNADPVGEVYVVFGRDSGFAPLIQLADLLPENGGDGSEGFVILGIDLIDFLGDAVSGAGDVNADGIDDIIVGAEGADPGGNAGSGESYVIFGRNSGFPAAFELASLLPENGGDGSEGFALQGVDFADSSGISVSTAGDLNADGIDDVVIGAVGADPGGQLGAGEAYAVFGRDTGFPAALPLVRLFPAAGGDGSEGFVVKGIDSGDATGSSVNAAGDVNGDGIDDLLIGAFAAAPGGQSRAGEAYVVYGSADGFPASFQLGSLLPLSVTVEGNCPGLIGFRAEGITSFGPFLLLGSIAQGDAVIPEGQCAGVQTGLATIAIRTAGVARGNGKIVRPGNGIPSLCGTVVQVLDLTDCEVSNVAVIPESGEIRRVDP